MADTPKPKRIFIYDNHTFDDIDPSIPIEDVRRAMLPHFPGLATAKVEETARSDGTVEIRFVKPVGNTGCPASQE